MVKPRYSVVIPVYKNEGSIPALLVALDTLTRDLEAPLEVVFVVDGSPDASFALLEEGLLTVAFQARLVLLSRNFGAFAAIRCGLSQATGEYIGVMAADLQEPPSLMRQFFAALATKPLDVVFGKRIGRADPGLSKLASTIFWGIYRRLVQRDVPRGGVDVFALTAPFRDRLVALGEANSSLLGLLFWLGGRREFIGYARLEREHGKSAWTLKKKVTYLLDSVFAFSDLPVRILMGAGMLGLGVAVLLGLAVLIARFAGSYEVPGYSMSMLAILFFGALNTLGIGIVGNYAWRAYENTKQRPLDIVSLQLDFPGKQQ
ncbi:glycosyltransferase family 2 protein [Xanthomonas campestris]|uniref:glycosyltransferase family 2 protein n=1 Tax=Xanthomonas campestris TaxID=339 RepID=UPI001E33F4C1|nr:glycosyltransferase family 2 protein [Xanthomonas campestris]MCC5045942.1 glycosyltransferase family 2 protein [Xanthomonas campestris]MCC5054248.1 glycosyltransferase family 2 protein [Xanthomonas campestris]MCC5058450.1 glycosyltransferase family 2 protein [Xanthomonas campestris]MEB1794588.1 glycosyltransferase family 2 protein [Xanthomonas campestris pv. campestris]